MEINKMYRVGEIIHIVKYYFELDSELNQDTIYEHGINLINGTINSFYDYDLTNAKIRDIEIIPVVCIDITGTNPCNMYDLSSIRNDSNFIFQSLQSNDIFEIPCSVSSMIARFNANGVMGHHLLTYVDLILDLSSLLFNWHNELKKSISDLYAGIGDRQSYHQAVFARKLCILLSAHYTKETGKELRVIRTDKNSYLTSSNRGFEIISQIISSEDPINGIDNYSIVEFLNLEFDGPISFDCDLIIDYKGY